MPVVKYLLYLLLLLFFAKHIVLGDLFTLHASILYNDCFFVVVVVVVVVVAVAGEWHCFAPPTEEEVLGVVDHGELTPNEV